MVTWLPLEKQKRCAPKQSMQCLLLARNGQSCCSSQALLSTCMCSTVSVVQSIVWRCTANTPRSALTGRESSVSYLLVGQHPHGF